MEGKSKNRALAYIKLGTLLTLFSSNSFASMNLGSLNKVEGTLWLALVFIGYPLASVILGYFWYKKQKQKWVWVISPFIILNIPGMSYYLFMLFYGLIVNFQLKRDFDIFIYLCFSLLISVWLSVFIYKRFSVRRKPLVIPYFVLPVVLVSFFYMSINYLRW